MGKPSWISIPSLQLTSRVTLGNSLLRDLCFSSVKWSRKEMVGSIPKVLSALLLPQPGNWDTTIKRKKHISFKVRVHLPQAQSKETVGEWLKKHLHYVNNSYGHKQPYSILDRDWKEDSLVAGRPWAEPQWHKRVKARTKVRAQGLSPVLAGKQR